MIFQINGQNHFMCFRYGQRQHPVKAHQITVFGGEVVRTATGTLIRGGAVSDLKMRIYIPCRYTRCQIFTGLPNDPKEKKVKLADARVFCMPEDTFDKGEGRHRALTAALADKSKFIATARKAAWTAYNERGTLVLDLGDIKVAAEPVQPAEGTYVLETKPEEKPATMRSGGSIA